MLRPCVGWLPDASALACPSAPACGVSVFALLGLRLEVDWGEVLRLCKVGLAFMDQEEVLLRSGAKQGPPHPPQPALYTGEEDKDREVLWLACIVVSL